MVIIDGNCVICAKYKSVLSLGDKNAYLKILNINLFHEDQNRFNKVSNNYIEDNLIKILEVKINLFLTVFKVVR